MSGAGARVGHLDAIIVGAGVGGLAAAHALKRGGIGQFTIIEKGCGVGGVWRDNAYPGVACDVPSILYCFSFAPKPDWSRTYATGPEILRYLEKVADHFDLRRHCRFGMEVKTCRWHEAEALWEVRCQTGDTFVAAILVVCAGQLNRPAFADVPGQCTFLGAQFHSARWDANAPIAGRRIGVIGNGASAVQIVPEVAKSAASVTIFQRGNHWILPRGDCPVSEARKRGRRRFPMLLTIERLAVFTRLEATFAAFRLGGLATEIPTRRALAHLEQSVPDETLRAKVTPRDTIGCKRILLSDDYLRTIASAGVKVVGEPIAAITPGGIATADGLAHGLDVIIHATGFRATEFLVPMDIQGRRGERLSDRWRDGASAYLGIMTHGFPNMFLTYGPNTNLGHNSIIAMIEAQARWIARTAMRMSATGERVVEVDQAIEADWLAWLDRGLARTVWAHGCSSWYKTADGRITNNWSGPVLSYFWALRRRRDPAIIFSRR